MQRFQIEYPADLPITAYREAILEALQAHSVLILAGETGSGKTTQLPKLCLEAGFGKKGLVGCTQPRRVAAYSIAERIAEELKVDLGKEVGVKVRFDDRTSPETQIKVMTDGILLAEIQQDRLLKKYQTLIIDEAHERSLNIDFILGYLRQIQPKRPDLKIVITSATIDTHHFAEAFPNSKVLQVEGRMFPVEVHYAPPPEDEREGGSIDWAAQVVEKVCNEPQQGDVLVFLPGERDIRELKDTLDGRLGNRVQTLALFSRLSRNEQHRIFESCSKRKIILSTNIAETSLTIPGIRYVIDSGLVRMSRYNSSTHTQRLPIESIAQSAARQRQGRAGRVSDGVCIRLYEEADLLKRPLYPDPEIRRSNLAEVILRMMAFGLGAIESFPFLEPPQPKAIKGAYKLLQDLGALDEHKELTVIGNQLARLPIDPTVGRMLIQAGKDHVLDEVLVIAAALSIPDPRERPFDAQAKADASHKKFTHPSSDFLSLLNIWDAYHDSCEKLSQKALRNFCKGHYLSYLRMREWRDLYHQLKESLEDLKLYKPSSSVVHADDQALKPTSYRYRSIHRALLTGLLTHVATKNKGNFYIGPHNRHVMLFPGSALFDRKADKKPAPGEPEIQKSRTPQWIVCGEWLETSNLYAHTVAAIEPDWLLEIADHVIQRSYGDPFWDRKKGRVLVREKRFLYGLLIHSSHIGYASIDPEKACEIFIQEALVADDIDQPFKFLLHNRAIKEEAESVVQRLRLMHGGAIDEVLFNFYAKRIHSISSVPELFKHLQSHSHESLSLNLEDLIHPQDLERANALYPKTLTVKGKPYDILYEADGEDLQSHGTLILDVEGFANLDSGSLGWIIPGYWHAWLENYLWSLPKPLRVQLSPLQDTIDGLHRALWDHHKKATKPFEFFVLDQLKLRLEDLSALQAAPMLRFPLKIRVCDGHGRKIVEGQDYQSLKPLLKDQIKALRQTLQETPKAQSLLKRTQMEYAAGPLKDWPSKTPPESIPLGDVEGIPLQAYGGLMLAQEGVFIHIFETKAEAQQASVAAYRALLFQGIQPEWEGFIKDCQNLRKIPPFDWPMPVSQALIDIEDAVKRYALEAPVPWPLQAHFFYDRRDGLKKELRSLAFEVDQWLRKAFAAYKLIPKGNPLIQAEIDQLFYPGFLKEIPVSQWKHLEVYLKALQIRSQKRIENPQKDQRNFDLIKPWLNHYKSLSAITLPPALKRKYEVFRWMIESYKVSVFAQALKAPIPVSPQKLQEAWTEIAQSLKR